MEEFDWIRKSDEDKGKDEKEEDEFATETQHENDEETQLAGVPTEERAEEKPRDELSTVVELEGEPFDPINNLSVLALVDIAPEVKKKRKVPQFFHIKRPVTIVGTGRRASAKVDDLKTVKTEHGAVVFKDGRFHIYPQEGVVSVDGNRVFKKGAMIRNGSWIEMGSARFIFLTTLEGKDDDVILS